MEKPILQDSPSFVDLCTLHQHAMRYYRLWIYACNTVLALATLVFTVFAVSVLVDPRISLLSGVELYQPTFLYAYVALLFQCGVLQAIGCVGALRLNQRLLNTYWTLLLVLMIGDILVGLVWAFRLDHIKSNLRPLLKQKLVRLYGKDHEFTEVWDWVQTHDMCCGVDGPVDFQRINDSTFGMVDPSSLGNDTWAPYLRHQEDLQNQPLIPKLPSTCCSFTVTPIVTTPETPASSEVPGSSRNGGGPRHPHHKGRGGGSGNQAKGDRSSNDPMNQKSVMQGGYYYQLPQQLKGSVHTSDASDSASFSGNKFHENNSPAGLMYPPSDKYVLSRNKNNSAPLFDNSNLIISDLRQYPLTEKIAASAPFGYFGPGSGAAAPSQPMRGGRVYERRKSKPGLEDGHGDRGRSFVTTTESPSSGRSPPGTMGICVLPTHLRQASSSSWPSPTSSSSYNSMENGRGSFEDSAESFSSTTTSTPTSQSSSTTSGPSSGWSTTSEPLGSTVPPVSSSSSSPVASKEKTSNSRNPHRHHHHPFPFTVSSDQHTDGCGDKILEWVEHSSDVLFVIGFCIIVFLKGCFIAILRYEIKEMIEKIKLLNGEDAGRTAAMNELIGLTSMYESGNDDSGEREGLMSGVHNNNQDTSNTNVDTVDGEGVGAAGRLFSSGSTAGGGGSGVGSARKDSIQLVKENHMIGNNIGGVMGQPPRFIGNHIGSSSVPTDVSSGTDEYPRVLAVSRDSMTSIKLDTTAVTEDDLESGLKGNKYHHRRGSSDSPPMIGNRKYYLHFHHHHLDNPHRNENGGRNIIMPRNGNNNNNNTTDVVDNAPGVAGVGTTASTTTIPPEAVPRVTNASIH